MDIEDIERVVLTKQLDLEKFNLDQCNSRIRYIKSELDKLDKKLVLRAQDTAGDFLLTITRNDVKVSRDNNNKSPVFLSDIMYLISHPNSTTEKAALLKDVAIDRFNNLDKVDDIIVEINLITGLKWKAVEVIG